LLSGLPEPFTDIIFVFLSFSAVWKVQDFVIGAEIAILNDLIAIAFYT
jgi:hypothetical protein